VVIGDTNPRLIGVYRHLVSNPGAVVRALAAVADAHRAAPDPKVHYIAQRAAFNAATPESVESAAGFLFVMNAGFNGVVRFNQGGECNTPYGEPESGKDIVRADEMRAIGKLLARAEVVLGDFEVTTEPAKRGDVVYFDPPYVAPAKDGRSAGFVGYSAGGFTLADRKRLGVLLRELDRRGVRWVLSDLSADHALEVYGLWNVAEVSVRRSVAARGEKRGKATEVLVTNF
jgi:DNA adenine methylase